MNTKPLIILGVLAILGGQMQAQQRATKIPAAELAADRREAAENLRRQGQHAFAKVMDEAAAKSERDAAIEAILPKSPSLDPSWVQAVYPVRFVAQTIIADGRTISETSGTAVAVGPEKLHTAKHIPDGMRSGYRPEVQVDGNWIPATFSPVNSKDLAVLTVSGVTLNHVPVRVPEYGERCTVYGLTTKSFAQGTYVGVIGDDGSAGVPVDACCPGVDDGDSGGGIFGDDGALLGTVSGLVPASRKVTKMVPIVAAAPAPVSAAQSGGAARVDQSCPNGQCQSPQAYQFQQPRRGFFRR